MEGEPETRTPEIRDELAKEDHRKLIDVVIENSRTKRPVVQDRLESLGFKKATLKITQAKKMQVAYDKYLFVMPEKIDEFNKKLRAETLQEERNAYRFKQLIFIPIEEYDQVPPDHVLDKLESAKADGIFD